MEQKTIGKFIAALRKANGLTQKDLAEQLNVSDKTISRWERDDGVPDLSIIPVIAEIFGVTCDELLRGERRSGSEREPEGTGILSAKGKKQQQRILTLSLASYRNRSFISIGLSLLGLIAAMICNFGFNRAYLGFLFACIFYTASILCQAIFINGAFTSVSDDDFSPESKNSFKQSVIHMASLGIGITAVLLAATLPLIVFPFDTYMGLRGESWLIYGILFGGLGLILYRIALYLLYAYLLKKGWFPADAKQMQHLHQKRNLQKRCFLLGALFFFCTALLHSLANEAWSAWNLAEEISFDNYKSFVHFMEQDVPFQSPDGSVSQEAVPLPEDTIYYDAFGNEIPAEIALQETITVEGNTGPKVVCTFLRNNDSVIRIRPANNNTGLPIAVLTQDALEAAKWKNQIINYAFLALYGLELAVVILYYFIKKPRS